MKKLSPKIIDGKYSGFLECESFYSIFEGKTLAEVMEYFNALEDTYDRDTTFCFCINYGEELMLTNDVEEIDE
jgi:hypothetical protein